MYVEANETLFEWRNVEPFEKAFMRVIFDKDDILARVCIMSSQDTLN